MLPHQQTILTIIIWQKLIQAPLKHTDFIWWILKAVLNDVSNVMYIREQMIYTEIHK